MRRNNNIKFITQTQFPVTRYRWRVRKATNRRVVKIKRPKCMRRGKALLAHNERRSKQLPKKEIRQEKDFANWFVFLYFAPVCNVN